MDEDLKNQESKESLHQKEIEKIAKELATLDNKPSIDIIISELAAYCLIVQLQAAARLPANTDITVAQARKVADALHSRLELPPTLENITRRGWSPEYDAIPSESAEEYLSRVPQREIIEVHNAYSIYSSEDEERGFMMFSRPQDWGNKKCWAYERFKFEWIQEKEHFINHAHCWYNPERIPEGDVPMTFAQGITMILMPGKQEQLCGNQYLQLEDFWCDDWGEIPPVYQPPDELFEEPPDELFEEPPDELN